MGKSSIAGAELQSGPEVVLNCGRMILLQSTFKLLLQVKN